MTLLKNKKLAGGKKTACSMTLKSER